MRSQFEPGFVSLVHFPPSIPLSLSHSLSLYPYPSISLSLSLRYSLSLVRLAKGVAYMPTAWNAYQSSLSFSTLLTAQLGANADPVPLLTTLCAPILDAIAALPGDLAAPLASWPSSITSSDATKLAQLLQTVLNRLRVQVCVSLSCSSSQRCRDTTSRRQTAQRCSPTVLLSHRVLAVLHACASPQGQTAYLAGQEGDWPEPLNNQALALLALSLAPGSLSSHQLVPKLAAYVAQVRNAAHHLSRCQAACTFRVCDVVRAHQAGCVRGFVCACWEVVAVVVSLLPSHLFPSTMLRFHLVTVMCPLFLVTWLFVPTPRLTQGAHGGYTMYTSRVSSTLAALSLALYDLSRSSASPEASLSVLSGSVSLLSHTFSASTSGTSIDARLANALAFQQTEWSSLASPPESMQMQASGRGELSVAAALVFIPASAPTRPMYRCVPASPT